MNTTTYPATRSLVVEFDYGRAGQVDVDIDSTVDIVADCSAWDDFQRVLGETIEALMLDLGIDPTVDWDAHLMGTYRTDSRTAPTERELNDAWGV